MTAAGGTQPFEDATHLLVGNEPSRSYGVTAFDIDDDGACEILVCSADAPNQILKLRPDGRFHDVAPAEFAAPTRSSLCAVVGDFLGTGTPTVYVVNSDSFSGLKRQDDLVLVRRSTAGSPPQFQNLAERFPAVLGNPYAARSVVAFDRLGVGRHGFFVVNHGAPSLLFEFDPLTFEPMECAATLGLRTTGEGRCGLAQPIVSETSLDVFVGNESGANCLFARTRQGQYRDVAVDVGLAFSDDDIRGAAVADFDGNGHLDVALCHWDGPTLFLFQKRLAEFHDRTPFFARTGIRARGIVVADFDNDGCDEVFVTVSGGANRLFRYLGFDAWEDVDLGDLAFDTFEGTGCAVGDFNGDGFLDLYLSNGEKRAQVNLLLLSRPNSNAWLRIQPLTRQGFPALGARVRLTFRAGAPLPGSGRRTLTKVVCSGQGYLCQMEPVAHFGLGEAMAEHVESIEIIWPGDGMRAARTRLENIASLRTTLKVYPPA